MRNGSAESTDQQKQLIQQALSAKMSGNHASAFQLYDEAIRMGEQGHLAQAYYNKGVLAMEEMQWPLALSCFQDAVTVNPDYEKAWVNLGAVFMRDDRYKEALYAFEKASGLVPDQVHSLFNRAYSLNRLGRYKEAYGFLKNLMEREDSTKDVLSVLGKDGYKLYSEAGLSCLQLGDVNNAVQFFRKAFNLNTADYQTCYNLAFIYDHLKDFEQALLFYDLSIALDPSHFKGYQGKACTFIHMKRFDEALQWITKAINIAPDNFEAYYNLACIYAGQKEKRNMINAILKTIALAPAELNIKQIMRSESDFSAFANDPDFTSALK